MKTESNNLIVSLDGGRCKLSRRSITGQEITIATLNAADLILLIDGAEALLDAQDHYQAQMRHNDIEYAKKQAAAVLSIQVSCLQASIEQLQRAGLSTQHPTVVKILKTIDTLSKAA